MNKLGKELALLISLAYLIFSLLWILLSDQILLSFSPEPERLSTLQTAKGMVFVALTAAGLYLLLRLGYGRIGDSEAYFRGVFEDAPLGMVIANSKGQPTRCNRSFERLLGYSSAELCRMGFTELAHPDDRPGAEADLQRLLRGESRGYTSTLRYRHHDGRAIWARLTTSAVRRADGRLGYIIGMLEDISVVQRQQEELQRRQAELALAQRIAHIGNWEYRIDDGKIGWSDEAYRIFGLEPQAEPIDHRRLQQFVHPDDRAAQQDYLQQLRECRPGGSIRPFSWRLVRPTGELRYVRVVAEARFEQSDRPVSVFGTIQDVTARELTENALRQSEERLSMALLVSHEGIWEWDMSGSTAWWNEPYEPSNAADPATDEPPPIPAWLLERVHPDDRPAVEASLRAALAERTGKQWDMEYRYLDDGEYRPVVDRAVITRDPRGRAHRVMGARLDMTPAMQARLEVDRLFELSPDVLLIGGLDGYARRVNPAATATLGYSEQELLSAPFYDFIHPDDHEITRGVLAELGEGRTVREVEIRIIDSDGATHWFQWYAAAQPSSGRMYAIGREITRQREAQLRLVDTEQRWTLALDGAGHGVWDWNAATGKVYFSRGWKRMLGYEEDEIGDSLADWETRVHPDDLVVCRADLRRHFGGESPMYCNEHRMRCKDGSYKWILDQGTVFERTEDGEPLRVVGTHTDITARKEAEQALEESRQVMRTMIDALPFWVSYFDRDKRYVIANRRYAETFGLPLAEIEGRLSREILPADLAEVHLPLAERCLAGEALVHEDSPVLPRHGQVHIQSHYIPVKDPQDGVSGGVVVVFDVTEQRRAEQDLAEKETRYRELVENMSAGVAVYGAVDDGSDFVLLEHNRAGERISRTDRAESTGRPVTEVFPGIARMGLLETFRRVWRSGEPEHHSASRYVDAGLELWVENYVFKLPGGQIVAVYDDVTESRQAAEQLRQAHEELERRVAERTAELFVANRELESFTYTVSHDLRAPLRAIRGFVQALREDYGDDLVDGARDYLAQIEASGARMGDMIDGLLTLSRNSRGELTRESVDLSRVAGEIAGHLRQSDPGRAVRVEIEPGLTAHADTRLVKTLLGNLMENAWKYTARTADAEIRVGRVGRDGELVFCVFDNGAGFEMRFANKLFEPFQRLHRQDEYPGMGIGLATVQRIVERHGGWITGEGSPGRGSTFCFTLAPGTAIDEQS